MSTLKTIFDFPNPVNDYAARTVASMVIIVCIAILITNNIWITLFLVYGFIARVATGPTLSPIGLLATKVIVPLLKLPNKPVPGPPKRFAQGIGLFVSAISLILFIVGIDFWGRAAIVILAFFAGLEAFLGFCTGCFIFNHLMKFGLIPKTVCEACENFHPTP
tara:strand:+ start:8118 stop:8606 length:489 start_codon:yes stop_codon:yes gene_type:complete